MNLAESPTQFDFAQRVWRYFSRFNFELYNPWVVIVELLLIGAVVYTVLRFLRGTRGAHLAQAVLMILAGSFLVVQVVAHDFKLDRINVLYPYFLGGVFLISLVAFQTELRRMLIRIGETRFFRNWAVETETVIDPIVSAVQRCAVNKIGALIAIERSTELGGVAETGVLIDSRISTELLETIFWPGSALHDLGVIIRRDRILAAGCQFPLAESADVDRSLGSRHRAAVGVTAEADVIVVVVSEETGAISVAHHGRLRRKLTPEQLREALVEMLTEPQPTQTSRPGPTGARAQVPPHGTTEAADHDRDSDAAHLDRRRPVTHG